MAGKSGPSSGIVRVSSGILGLDKLIEGGFPQGSTTLISGTTGTGKTIFQLQFLWEGLKKGEKGLFITLEESPEDIKNDAIQFGWDFSKYEKKGFFKIMAYDPFEMNIANMRLKDMISANGYKRLAIDSSSLFGMYVRDEFKIRKGLYNIVSAIKSAGCTALVSAEIPAESGALSRYGVEEFVADGVIFLGVNELAPKSPRTLKIIKMRRTAHSKISYPFEITNTGICLFSEMRA